jgi:hypothetical protein
MTLRVGIAAAPSDAGAVELVCQAERLGVDSVWVPEFWAGDALTPLAYLAARTSTIRLATGIVQLGARTPAMLAMSAMSLQSLSGGRFVLGIGSSGPQVMDGWHGVRFDKPVRRTAIPGPGHRGTRPRPLASNRSDAELAPRSGSSRDCWRPSLGGLCASVRAHVVAPASASWALARAIRRCRWRPWQTSSAWGVPVRTAVANSAVSVAIAAPMSARPSPASP